MRLTRKDFLALAGMAAAGLLVPGCSSPTTGYRVKERAGLLFNPDDIPRIRKTFTEEPIFAGLRASLAARQAAPAPSGTQQDTRMGPDSSPPGADREASQKFLREEVRLNDQLYDIVTVGDLIENNAFYYLMTGDEDAAALAIEALDTLMRFHKWDYFLEGGTVTIGFQRAPSSTKAVALGVEWLGDRITIDQRHAYLRTMAEKGLEPCYWAVYGMRHKDRVKGWGFDEESTYLEHRPGDRGLDFSNWPTILDGNNLKAVPANSLLIGALTYQREFGDSEDTRRWIEQALYSYGTLNTVFEEDGSYDEGASYSVYTAIQLAESATVMGNMLERSDGNLVNWPGYGDYLVQMTMPTHETPTTIVNFGDNWRAGNSAVPFYIASRYKDGATQWLGRERYITHDLRSAMWYDPSVPTRAPQGPNLWRCDLDWIVARSGYEMEDLVVAMRSGGPSNHEHSDRNSVLIACFGEQLLADLEKAPYTRTDPSWLLRTTAGHNAVLVNGLPHQYHDGSEGTNASQASAHLTSRGETNGIMHWSSDATHAYALVDPNIASVVRSMFVLPDRQTVLMLDNVNMKPGTSATLEARFFGYNMDGNGRMKKMEHGYEMSRPNAHLNVRFMGSGPVTSDLAVLPIAPERQAHYPFAFASLPASERNWLLSVLCAGKSASPAATGRVQRQDDGSLIVTVEKSGMEPVQIRLTPEADDPSVFGLV